MKLTSKPAFISLSRKSHNGLPMNINGILLLYHLPLSQDAPTILENVNAFKAHSQFKVWNVNTHLGFPKSLANARFSTVALHYSLFGNWPFSLTSEFLNYLAQSQSSYKVAFFQDEYQYCRERFDFLNRYRIDCIYTLLEPRYFKAVYQDHTCVAKIIHHLTGYVSDELIELARRLTLPDEKRSIDFGYRGRPLPLYLGRGAQEKTEIAIRFRERAAHLGLRLDIETSEQSRIYGDDWYRFIARCRAFLGVEAGVSIFDLDGTVREAVDRLLAQNPDTDFAEISEKLQASEDRIYYRTISPRHFEAAAFRVCQVLFEGDYTGILKPMVHYIALKKDFSNFDECLRLFQDKAFRDQLTENAYRDLIASGKYSYQEFMRGFDRELLNAGLEPEVAAVDAARFTRRLDRDRRYLEFRARKNSLMYHKDFPGRRALSLIGGPPLRMMRKLKQALATEKSPSYLKERN